MSPEIFLEFWLSKNCFLPLRNVPETDETSKGSKRGRHVTSVDWLSLGFRFRSFEDLIQMYILHYYYEMKKKLQIRVTLVYTL